MLVTSWEPNRLAMAMTSVVDAAAACLRLEPGVDDSTGMLAAGFRRVFMAGTAPASPAPRSHAMRGPLSAMPGGKSTTAGTCVPRGAASPAWNRSARSLRASPGAPPPLPGPFRKSVAFRLYLAERDVYVRSAIHRPCPFPAPQALALRPGGSEGGGVGTAMLQRHADEFASTVAAGAGAPPASSGLSRATAGCADRTSSLSAMTRGACASCGAGSCAPPPNPPRCGRDPPVCA